MNDERPEAIIDGPADPDGAVARAGAELESGGVVIVATDTVYGLAARVGDDAAIDEMFALKDRPADRRVAVLVADVEQATDLVELCDGARALVDSFWPGPLTIVAPRRPGAPGGVGDGHTIGVRCPDDPVLRAIAARVGPLAATSANRHGRPTPTRAAEVAEIFPGVRVVVDGGERPGSASTVVDLGQETLTVLRPGPIDEDRLREVFDTGLR